MIREASSAILIVFLLCAGPADAARAEYLKKKLIGGEALAPGQLPQLGTLVPGPETCSATLVGASVIATAAHCCPSEQANFITSRGEWLPVRLLRDPRYVADGRTNLPDDFASPHDLCFGILNAPVEGIPPLSIAAEPPQLGEKIAIAGRGRPDYEPRIGRVEITRISSIGFTLQGVATRTAAAPGDSGGAALKLGPGGRVTQIGVISTSTRDREQFGEKPYTTGVTWIRADDDFVRSSLRDGLRICGLNDNCPSVELIAPDPLD